MREMTKKARKVGKYVGLFLMVVLAVLVIARLHLTIVDNGWNFTVCQCPWTCPDHEFSNIINLE